MKNTEVYICDLDHNNIEEEKKVFEANGIKYEWLHCKDQDELIEKCQGAKVFLTQYVYMDKKTFEGIPTLKCIIRYGVGYDSVNLKDASDYGIVVCNVPDYGTSEVADHAFALILSLLRKTHKMDSLVKQGVWDYAKGIPAHRGSSTTLGVMGIGRIGSAVIKRAEGFGYNIIACEINEERKNKIKGEIKFVSFDELLRNSDLITIHCSLNENTYHIFGEEEFKKMKSGSFLVNVSRGAIVDEKALDMALTNGILAGAGIDVVEKEPLPKDHFLLNHENIIVTPHMAWYSEESARELKKKCAQEAVRFLFGQDVLNSVNLIRR